MTRPLATAIALLAVAAPAASGQRIHDTRFAPAPSATGTSSNTRENPVIEIAKWTTGGLALAAATFAFMTQNEAEDRLEELERFCLDDPNVCRELTADGAYADPALEARYQDIRGDYRNSRLLLVGAHVLAATSVVLFIVDLPREATPDNIPYDPPALRIGILPGGVVEAAIRYPVSNILTRSP